MVYRCVVYVVVCVTRVCRGESKRKREREREREIGEGEGEGVPTVSETENIFIVITIFLERRQNTGIEELTP